ncbi:MAG: hypothetical protein ABIQ57_18595, partial [Candidatus Kapaibacterium sp.]
MIYLTPQAIARLRGSLLLLTFLLMASVTVRAQGDTTRADSVPGPPAIERYLNPDGTLNLGSGFSGSLDARGWGLSTASDGSPRFRRLLSADSTADSTR